jgi:hypothetical protein
MKENGQILVFVTTLVLFLFVLGLVRRRKIGERFAVLWLGISFVLLLLSSVGYPYLFRVAQFVGVPYPPSALFFLAISGLTLLIINLFAWVSKLNDRTRILTQQIALLSDRLSHSDKSTNLPKANPERAASQISFPDPTP